MSEDTRITINLSKNNYEDVKKCCANKYLNSNISEFFNRLYETAKEKNLLIGFGEGISFNITQLEELMEKEDEYFNFRDITGVKKITKDFKRNFNNITDIELKKSCYNFIKVLMNYLQLQYPNKENKPAIGTSQNISIYNSKLEHMLYINVKEIGENHGLNVSNLLQFNQRRNQPEIPVIWNEIKKCLGYKSDDSISKLELFPKDFKKLIKHFTH